MPRGRPKGSRNIDKNKSKSITQDGRYWRSGRTTMLSEELTNSFADAIRHGNYPKIVAQAHGISEATYYMWMANGRKGKAKIVRGEQINEDDILYINFLDAVTIAEAEAETNAVEILQKALPSNPDLILKFLERRFPNRWKHKVSMVFIVEEAKKLCQQLGIPEEKVPEIIKEMEEIASEAYDKGYVE